MTPHDLKKMTMQKRIEFIAPLIKKYDSPISVPIRIAQAIQESSVFTSELALEANNGFGIKASPPWTGASHPRVSGEHRDGKKTREESDFRKYGSIEESVKDHASFFTSTEFRKSDTAYGLAIKATTYEEEAKNLGPKFPGDKSSYAGDPKYASSLLKHIKKYNLTQYDEKKGTGKMAYIGIDIGHGKNSPARGGSRGWTGDEHSFNSKVAIRTKALLEALGHKVTFGVQNPNSNEVGLAPRTSYFNTQKVDVLISIHANAHSNTSVNGISAFYDRYGRGRDSASLKLAKAIMDEYRKQKQVIWSTGEVPSYRGNWTDFHMNRESVMPSVLMELGFMTGNRDREYIFGSKQAQFVEDMAQGIASGVDKYFGGAGKTGSTYNPQGLQVVDIPNYTDPRLPFKEMKVGDKVTIRDPFKWYDPDNHVWMISNKHDEIIGTEDTIEEVFEVKDGGASYSKRYYLLKNYRSFIFEQDLEEPRANWGNIKSASKYVVEKGDYLYKIAEEFDATVADIKKWNNLDTNVIHVGQVLFIIEPQEVAEDVHQEPESVPDGIEKKEDQPQDKGEETKAIELQEGELMDWKGNIYARISK